jgi:hypothetical protein
MVTVCKNSYFDRLAKSEDFTYSHTPDPICVLPEHAYNGVTRTSAPDSRITGEKSGRFPLLAKNSAKEAMLHMRLGKLHYLLTCRGKERLHSDRNRRTD